MDVIVTGSTGGIGHCLVQCALASPNIEKVYCQYRNQKKFETLFDIHHPDMILEKHDAAYRREDSYIIQELYKNKPESIVCVYTAFAINPIKRIGSFSPKEVKENIYSNVLDIVMFTNWLIQFKQTSKTELKLINIDSGAAYKPLKGWGMYSASKAYVNMFLKTVQLENPDVKIVSYEPGVVDTPMQEVIRKTDEAVFDQVHVFKEYFDKKMLHKPDKIAEDIWKRFIDNWDGTDFREGYNI